jgi:hypothetical protein
MKKGAGGEIYSNSEADSSGYGIDIVDKLSDILSEQISKSMGVLSIPEKRKKSLNKIYKK